MAEEAPISTTVSETTTIDTGASSESVGDVNKAFADFWAEEDKDTAPAAPAAPGEGGAAQETSDKASDKKLAEKPEPAAPEPVETVKTGDKSELTDEDIDKMGIRPEANPSREQIEDFNKIRQVLRSYRERYQETRTKAEQLEQDLAAARQNAWTAETKADYEHAASIRRRFDFASAPEFQEKYQTPINNQYQSILQEAVDALPDRESAQAWAKHMLENYSPDQLTKQWWQQKVIAQIPDSMDAESVRKSITDLLRMQKDRDSELVKHTETRESFDKWNTDRNQQISQRVQEEILAEIRDKEKIIQDYLPRNEDDAKTNDERAAIQAHNSRFNTLNDYFKERMADISANGPRGWVRVSIEATRAQILDQEIKSLQKDYKEACSERDKYKAELDKIAGARRKLSTTTGTPAGGSKKDSTLSVKNLDPRKAMDEFFNEIDRNS